MTCGCRFETDAGDDGETGEERGAIEMYRRSSRRGGSKGGADVLFDNPIRSSRKGADGLFENPMHSKGKGTGKGEGKDKAMRLHTSRTAAVEEGAKVKVGRPAPKRALRQTSRQRTDSERDEKEYMDAYSEHQRVTSSDGVGRGRDSAYASFVQDVVAAARDEEKNEDENSLEAFLKTLSAMAREALEQRAAAGGGAAGTATKDTTSTIVRDNESEEDEENDGGSVGIFIGERKVAEPAGVMMPGGRDESESDSAPMTWLGNPIESSRSFKFSSRGSSGSVGGLAGNAGPAGDSAEKMMVVAGGAGGGDGGGGGDEGGGGDGEGGRQSVRFVL